MKYIIAAFMVKTIIELITRSKKTVLIIDEKEEIEYLKDPAEFELRGWGFYFRF